MQRNFYSSLRDRQFAQQAAQQQLQDGLSTIVPTQQHQEGEGDAGGGSDPNAGGGENESEKLLKALQAEREQRKQFEKDAKTFKAQLEAFNGLDPDLARKAKEILAQQEEWAQKESKIRSDVEQTYTPKLQELEKSKTAAEQALLNYKRDVTLEREFNKAGGFAGEFEDVAGRLQGRVTIDPTTGELKVLDKAGKPSFTKGEPTTIAQLISELKGENLGFARHFKGNEGSGAGLNGSGKYNSGDPSLSGLSAWEKVERMRAAQ